VSITFPLRSSLAKSVYPIMEGPLQSHLKGKGGVTVVAKSSEKP
jgi:hypothetical protein